MLLHCAIGDNRRWSGVSQCSARPVRVTRRRAGSGSRRMPCRNVEGLPAATQRHYTTLSTNLAFRTSHIFRNYWRGRFSINCCLQSSNFLRLISYSVQQSCSKEYLKATRKESNDLLHDTTQEIKRCTSRCGTRTSSRCILEGILHSIVEVGKCWFSIHFAEQVPQYSPCMIVPWSPEPAQRADGGSGYVPWTRTITAYLNTRNTVYNAHSVDMNEHVCG